MTFLVAMAALHRRRPRSTRSLSSAVATIAFSVDPSLSESGTFVPSLVIPSATTCVIPASSMPSIITTASSSSERSRESSSSSASRARRRPRAPSVPSFADSAIPTSDNCTCSGSATRVASASADPASTRCNLFTAVPPVSDGRLRTRHGPNRTGRGGRNRHLNLYIDRDTLGGNRRRRTRRRRNCSARMFFGPLVDFRANTFYRRRRRSS